MQATQTISENNVSACEYDYVFCGTGASASLLLLELHQNNLLQHANVLLIDPDKKDKRDKTFCFWADADDPISVDLKSLISHTWDHVALAGEEIEPIWPMRYNHISSIDLYNQVHRLTQQYQWHKINTCADEVGSDEQGPFVCCNGEKIRAKYIFDSRPPIYHPPQEGETHISQSFVGWMIETEQEIKKPNAFRFMDFQIEQQGSTQFVYVLPFSARKALVEVTRFGAETINHTQAENLLADYIQRNFGAYTVADVETGCIPMSNTVIESNAVSGIVLLGARNYHIKPSTGYAFKNMYYHARNIASAIKHNKPVELLNKTHVNAHHHGRHSFYDGLLLDILKNKPQEGKRIFEALLAKVDTKKILNFLDEKTGIATDISIFSQLPWQPFISTLLSRSFVYPWFRPLLLTLMTCLLVLAGNYSAIQNHLAYGLFFAGLVAVGIPHGAVDHLLETGKWNRKGAPVFIIRYLMLAAGMGLLWYALPGVALAVFLAYSSWHFGQADGKKWNFTESVSFLWGLSVLFYILGTHLQETNVILMSMGQVSLPFACSVWALLPWFLWALYHKQTSFFLTLCWLMLSSQLPLLIAFGIYFIGQHSLNGWQDIRRHLQLSHSRIWLHSVPFHAGAWLLLAGFLFLWPLAFPHNDINQWAVFFVFIACISFPHTIYMNVVYRKKG